MKIKVFVLLLLFVDAFFAYGQRNLKQTPVSNISSRVLFDCTNWLSTPTAPSYFDVGQISVTGNKVTVEAVINRTTPYSPNFLYAGDVVSKHDGPTDVNYLLRPNSAEITTIDAGGQRHYYVTPAVCDIELNKTYHVALVYDGVTLKFYRNGFLMSHVDATGNLFQNNWKTRIGFYESQTEPTNFIGYINEVRIWNVAKTQAEIRNYMMGSLPAPTAQLGLLAYYTFDNLNNKQGNPAYNGTLGGSASINKTNPTCSNFVIDSCGMKVNSVVTPSFTATDTVCVNTPVNISNTSTGTTNYFWNFCVAGVNTTPTAVNLGNFGGLLSQPVFSDIVEDNGNYYVFVVDFYQGALTRLDFGNSLLNTPTATNIPNPSGALNGTYGKEGIQVVKNEGKWYAIVVGGTPSNGSVPKIVKIEFGTNITNPAPTGTDWGNIGGLLEPIDLHLFQDNGNWYGFTTNADNNTITRFNFTNSFNNTPTAVNLGNIGGVLNYPTGIYVLNDNGSYRVFVTNGQVTNSLVRLDFGNSLLNTPTAVDLGNPSGTFHQARDFTILKFCDEIAGFAVNGTGDDLVKFDFHNNATSVPTGVSLGNIGNFNFPHSLSKIFRVGNDLYSLVTNVSNNTVSRIKFSGCNSSSLPSSNLQNPPPITYNQPGTYNINLSVDEGLPTQSSICKKIVVMPALVQTPTQSLTVCGASPIKIGTGIKQASYVWNNGATTDSISITTPGVYWVRSSRFGCSIADTFKVATCVVSTPSFTTPDTVCVNTPVNITNTSVGAASFYWNFCVADLNKTPAALNLGNTGGFLAQPTFVDYVFANNNYYGFVTNYQGGNLVRLDFGNSLLNTPVAVNLGNFSGMLTPTNIISEGLQMVFNEGKWYAIIVGSSNTAGTQPRIFKVEFGANITNPSPVATDWGNVGNLAQPIDLHIFKDGNNWYGFTANSENNTITRFNFTNSFNNTPTAINLGNLGNLSYPTGIYAIDDNGFWRVFVVNGGNNTTTSGTWSLSRIDFGSSLLNTPTAVNLGNPGNTLAHPRDITIMKSCGQIVGFATNGNPNFNDIIKLDFNNNLSSIPSAISLGNIGSLNFPHSVSKLFRIGDDLYSFITNAAGSSNSITRLRFTGCTNASVASSSLQNPPPVTYNTPGTYHINLTVDDGLPTQNAYCRQVVVLPPLAHTPLLNITACADSVKIGAHTKGSGYLWNNGATTDSIYAKPGIYYWIKTSRFGCDNVDSFLLSPQKISIQASNDTGICAGKTVQLNASGASTYIWTPSQSLSNANVSNPLATPSSTTQYTVIASNAAGCKGYDTVMINVNPLPDIAKTNDTTICHDKAIQLNVTGGATYSWTPSPTLSNPGIPNPVASPSANTTYYVTVTTNSQCSKSDSVRVAVKALPVFSISSGGGACAGVPVQLNASGGNSYSWQPATGLSNAGIANPVALSATSMVYTVKITENVCKDSASLSTILTLLAAPNVQASSSNDVDCTQPTTQFNVTGAVKYTWQPATGLNDSTIANPLATPANSTTYIVKGTDLNGCSNYDSVKVLVTHAGDLLLNMPNAFTPNNDGRNDCFGLGRFASLLQNVQFSVYNRFGQRVFYTTHPTDCWDGRFKGKIADAGGYAYILQATTFCGTIFKKGIVMLIH